MGASDMAYDQMMAAFGALTKRTGDVHTMDWGSFHSAIGGGTEDAPALWMTGCKNAYPATQLVAFPCSAANGSGYIMDVDFGSGTMHTLKPVSASADPGSPFYTRNAEDFAAGRFRSLPLTAAGLAAEQTSTTTLTVGSGEPTRPDPTDPSRPAKAKLKLAKFDKRVKGKGRLVVKVTCASSAGERCAGRIDLTAAKRKLTKRHLGKKQARKQVKIASRKYSIAAGTHPIELRLSRKGRKALRRERTLTVRLTWKTKSDGGATHGQRRLLIRGD
jgi:hypothetical protein